MKKIKHDPELARMAKKAMKLPHNRKGTDKSHVLQALYDINLHYWLVREGRGR